MKLLNKLFMGAIVAFSAVAAYADDIYEAKKVECFATKSGETKSASMTLLGTASDGCQIWGGSNDEVAGGTGAYWLIDANKVYYSVGSSVSIYPWSGTTDTFYYLSDYIGTISRKLTSQTPLYQFLKVTGEKKAQLFIASPEATQTVFDDICIDPKITLTVQDGCWYNDYDNCYVKDIKFSVTGIASEAIEYVTLKWSYDGGQSWDADSLHTYFSQTDFTLTGFPSYNKEKVRFKVSLHPKSKYRAVTKAVYDSEDTQDVDLTATSRTVYAAKRVIMVSEPNNTFESIDYINEFNLLGLTPTGYQIWGGVQPSDKGKHVYWCVDVDGHGYYDTMLSKDETDFNSNTIYCLDNSFHKPGNIDKQRNILSGDDYAHIVKVNAKMSLDYYSTKYDENHLFKPTDFQVHGAASLEPTGNYTVNTTDGSLMHNVTYSINNANGVMLDSVVIEVSCDGGTTWTTGATITKFDSNPANTATVAVDNISPTATKVRYRLTAYIKKVYKTVCDDMTFTSLDQDVTLPTDGLNNVVVYKRVMSEDQLVAGDTYLIVNAASGKALGYQDTNTRQGYPATLSGNKVKLAKNQIATSSMVASDKTRVYELTLGGEAGQWTFYDKVKGKYLYAAGDNSGNNYYLKLQDKANTDASKASITINSGNAVITFGGDAVGKTIRYNKSNSIFSCYTEWTNDAVQLYRKTSTISLSSARYATLYTDDAYTMPEGVTGYTVTLKKNDAKTLSLNAKYEAGTTVPPLTPLLLKGNEGTYDYLVVSSDAAAPTDNLLHGTLSNATTSVEGNNLYYKLSKPEDDAIGFYWGAENGEAFTNAANKAYLALPNTEAASQQRGFAIEFDDPTTGISTIAGQSQTPAASSAITDLNGRRISTLQGVQKGVYIKDGKKVLVK